ncbi:MAG: bifunctional phosphopantothenoylcysteine decarboxylase/phosphopantothenate--cysteine ligase CoaBC [Cyclobacteriaceae bacterium]|nr:bifunctional phosphopantothenoylcysteine decarboxylase/phosphopantothenate--cysteine ligase CoaBC [Cyclobacteriaceae bacterium]
MLRGKNILVGITGSIAAYKSALLVRSLVREGANVKVIMTPSATEFISPLTISTLSKNPVNLDFFNEKSGEWTSHVELGLWADLYVIAPATANSIAKFANGICEDLLAAVYLSARCPVYIAPAMDVDMYHHPSTRNNIAILMNYGNSIIDAEHGELASGLIGEGRMAEPEEIVEILRNHFHPTEQLAGKTALVTAGPTLQAIDPVRFISNHSTGKMGYAIAKEMADQGVKVKLVSGPVSLTLNHKNIEVIPVTSAEEMLGKSIEFFPNSDITILAAAVADYKPAKAETTKIKKKQQSLEIVLEPTVDIAATLGQSKSKNQFIVGFALETENELDNAQQKLWKKNFDMIVLNSLKDQGAGFGYDTNKVTIIHKDNKVKRFDLKSKREVARDIVREIIAKIHV